MGVRNLATGCPEANTALGSPRLETPRWQGSQADAAFSPVVPCGGEGRRGGLWWPAAAARAAQRSRVDQRIQI